MTSEQIHERRIAKLGAGADEYRAHLTERLNAERLTCGYVHALGPERPMTLHPGWKRIIRQRLADERNERTFQRTER